MKKILVGVDFTEADRPLLAWAEKLAQGGDTSVILLHSVPPLAQWVGCTTPLFPRTSLRGKRKRPSS